MTSAAPPLNAENLDAAALLAIDVQNPEKIFEADSAKIKTLYHKLVKRWHPDRNKDAMASDVIGRLAALKESALEKIEKGTWQEAGYFSCRLTDGKKFRAKSDAVRDFELGVMHIGPTAVTFVVRKEFAALVENAKQSIKKLRFENDKMRETYAPRLPTETKFYESDDALILVVRKYPDDVLMRDLIPFAAREEKFPCHAAWMVSRMTEMARYLDYAGLAHNAITPDTVFVSPSNHTIGLFGGWWYAKEIGEPLSYAPTETIDFLPDTGGKPIIASNKVDLEMVKAAGREILGDRGGTRLPILKSAPEPMINYLRLPSSGKAQDDLASWYQKALPASFGPRRFTELKVTYGDIYQPGG